MPDPCYSCGGPVRIDHQLAAGAVIDTRVCLNPTCETNEQPRTDNTPLP